MKNYLFSGAAAFVLSALATPGYCTTIILNFDANAYNLVCSTSAAPYSCIGVGGGGAPLSPTGNPPQFATTLISFGNIAFNEVTITGDPSIGGGSASTFAFASSGSAFAYVGTTLTNTGSITSGPLNGISGTLITDVAPAVVATEGGGVDPVYFANGTVTISTSLLTALGLNPGSYTASLGSDAGCNYPEGTPNAQTTGSLAGPYAGGCAIGFGPNDADLNAQGQYLEIVISSVTTSTPEPETSLLLGFALIAFARLTRKRRLSKEHANAVRRSGGKRRAGKI